MADKDEKTEEGNGSKWSSFSPLVTAIIAGLTGLLGTAAGTYYQGSQNLKLESSKFEFNKEIERQKEKHELITKMIGTGNSEQAAKNLLFLVKAGLIEDPDQRITKLASETKNVPVLPSLSQALEGPAIIDKLFSPDPEVSDSARDSFISRGTTQEVVLLNLINRTIENKDNKRAVKNALMVLETYGPYKGAAYKVAFTVLFSNFKDETDEEIKTHLERVRINFEADQAGRQRPKRNAESPEIPAAQP